MATFGQPMPRDPLKPLPMAVSDPELLLKDISAYPDEGEPWIGVERTWPEWSGACDESKLPSNRFGGMEPE